MPITYPTEHWVHIDELATCRRCGTKGLAWQKSRDGTKNYLCETRELDSGELQADRKAFHRCPEIDRRPPRSLSGRPSRGAWSTSARSTEQPAPPVQPSPAPTTTSPAPAPAPPSQASVPTTPASVLQQHPEAPNPVLGWLRQIDDHLLAVHAAIRELANALNASNSRQDR